MGWSRAITTVAPSPPGIRRSLALVFVNRYAVMVISIVATLTLARLVTPAETGLFSVTASVIFLAQAVREVGIVEFLMQDRDLTSEKIRTAFGMTIVMSWSLGGAIFLSRGWIADLYGTPELGHMIGLASISFLVAPVSSTVMALLNRNMQFGQLLRISISANLVNAMVSITLTSMGFGATGLTIGLVAMGVTSAAMASLAMRSWDHFIPSLSAWRQILSFGAYVSVTNIVNQIAARAPDLIIGRGLGYTSVGIYNRASGTGGLFGDLVASAIQSVTFPTFARMHREGEDLRRPYLTIVALMTGVAFPALTLVSVTAEPVVEALLGHQWSATVPLIPYIAAATMIEGFAPMSAVVFTVIGQVSQSLRITLLVRGTQVASILLFVHFDLHWVVMGQLGCSVLGLVLNARALRRFLRLGILDLFMASWRSVLLAIVTVVPVFVVLTWRSGANDPVLVTLALAYSVAGAAWLVGVAALRHPFAREIIMTLRPVRARAMRLIGRE